MTRATARYRERRESASPVKPLVDRPEPAICAQPGGGWSHRHHLDGKPRKRVIPKETNNSIGSAAIPIWGQLAKPKYLARPGGQRSGPKVLNSRYLVGVRPIPRTSGQRCPRVGLPRPSLTRPTFRWVVVGKLETSRLRSSKSADCPSDCPRFKERRKWAFM